MRAGVWVTAQEEVDVSPDSTVADTCSGSYEYPSQRHQGCGREPGTLRPPGEERGP